MKSQWLEQEFSKFHKNERTIAKQYEKENI